MEITEVVTEIQYATTNLGKSAMLDPKRELEKNLYPLLLALAESTASAISGLDERVAEVSDIVGDVLSGTESVLQAEVSAKIVAVIVAGLHIMKGLAAWTDMPENLRTAIAGYGMASQEVLEEIRDMTVSAEDEEGGSDD